MSRIGGFRNTGPADFQPEGAEVSSVQEQLDGLADALTEVRSRRGLVDIGKLEAAIDETGDPALWDQLESIIDKFPKEVTRSYSAGCGGGRRTVTEEVAPKKLTRDQVQRVLADIAAAKAAAEVLDANEDGILTDDELDAGGGDDGFAQELLENATGGAIAAIEEAAIEDEPEEPTSSGSTFRSGCS